MKQDLKMKRGRRVEKRGWGKRGGRETGAKNRRTAWERKIFEVALKIRRTRRCSRQVRAYMRGYNTRGNARGNVVCAREERGGERERERDRESERKAVVARGSESAREQLERIVFTRGMTG